MNNINDEKRKYLVLIKGTATDIKKTKTKNGGDCYCSGDIAYEG